MEAFLIETTRQQGLQPIGSAADRSYARLVQILEAWGLHENARMFAEPVSAPDGSTVDWYYFEDGEIHTFGSLSDDERDRVASRLSVLINNIEKLAERLERTGAPSDRADASALRACLEVPDESYIRLIGNQPVLIAWAHRKAGKSAPTGVLYKMVPHPSGETSLHADPPLPAGPGPVGPERRSVPWLILLWALVLILLALLLSRLALEACGISPRNGIFSWCPAVADASELEQSQAEAQQLELRIADAQRELLRRRNSCAVEPTRPAAPPPSEPDASEETEFDSRVRESGGESGQMQITLIWDGPADLDLHLFCGRDQISFQSRSGCGGGQLDLDANAGQTMDDPVENIRWSSAPPSGRYRVEVDLYSRRGESRERIPYEVQVRRGDDVETFEGAIGDGARRAVTDFEIP